jgi:transcriptional regulator of acetoin/glycerol metabolism
LHSDFRLVAATHKPLLEMTRDGRFRQDLYYRISAFPIQLPALRERRGDIALLVDSILQRIGNAADAGGGRLSNHKLTVSQEALVKLEAYIWPGNIREMRNVLDRACLLSDDGVIRPEHLPESILEDTAQRARSVPAHASSTLSDEELLNVVNAFSGTRKALASHLGWSERTLYRRLKALVL